VAIANKLARAVYRIIAGDSYKEIGYLRGDPKEQKIKSLVQQLKLLGVDVHHVNHQKIISKRKIKVDSSGVIQT
jgi:hypothetical protein